MTAARFPRTAPEPPPANRVMFPAQLVPEWVREWRRAWNAAYRGAPSENNPHPTGEDVAPTEQARHSGWRAGWYAGNAARIADQNRVETELRRVTGDPLASAFGWNHDAFGLVLALVEERDAAKGGAS